jgi:diguanylate cyclase (GGDEF)-like protein/PAS domain S-box-containing protein
MGDQKGSGERLEPEPLQTEPLGMEALENLLDGIPIGILDLNHRAQIQYANAKAQTILGRSWPALENCSWQDLVYAEDLARVTNAWNKAYKLSQPLSCFYRICRPNNSIIPIYMRADPQTAFGVSSSHYASYIQDDRERQELVQQYTQKIESDLEESERRYQFLAESVPIGLYRNNASGQCVYINQKTCEILDISFEDCLGHGWADRLHPDDADRMFHSWQEAFERKDTWQEQYRFVHRDGSIVWVLAQCIFTFNEQGENTGSIGALTDITRQKVLEAQLEAANARLQQLAHLDGLTGIPNRRYFDETLEQEWHRLRREEKTIAILMIDIDYFKAYNDTYGHIQGDQILKTVAYTLSHLVHRPADFVARFGGEEFVCVLPGTNEDGALKIAQDIQREIDRLAIPHRSSAIAKTLTLSIGVSCIIPSPRRSLHNLIDGADQALYQAKRQGRHCIVLYQDAR